MIIKSKHCFSILYSLKCSFHAGSINLKFITNTELIHQSTKYGHSAYPKRPNDSRVPFNVNFGITYLNQQPNLVPVNKSSISIAMKMYMEKVRLRLEFMEQQQKEFDFGRKYLANMMAVPSMTQNEIDKAIEYLFPSGLFDYRARPRMKPPIEIYPTIKQAQFRVDGRPLHSMFYTGRSNFYQICFEIQEQIERLKNYEDEQLRLGIIKTSNDSKFEMKSSEWLNQNEMQGFLLERIENVKYDALIFALERLANHPYSKLCQDFLMKFRKVIKIGVEMMDVPTLKYDTNGRSFMESIGRRKLCLAYVTVRGNGTGKVDINNKGIDYFDFIQDREQVMTPLKFVGLLNQVDIECRTMHLEFSREYSDCAPPFPSQIRELGTSAQSGAIRYALSLALRSFVDKETVEKMHSVGLLTPDTRVKERKKWGQEGARRKYTWKKR